MAHSEPVVRLAANADLRRDLFFKIQDLRDPLLGQQRRQRVRMRVNSSQPEHGKCCGVAGEGMHLEVVPKNVHKATVTEREKTETTTPL